MKNFDFHMTAPTEDGLEVDLTVTYNLMIDGSRFLPILLYVSPILNGKAYDISESDWTAWLSEVNYQMNIDAEKMFDSYKTYRREAI